MMTTSDDRRKAAELMRNEAADFRRLGEEYDSAWDVDLGDVPATFQDITHYVGLDGAVRVDTIFDRIADFIDPTCEVDSIEPVEDELGQTVGYEFYLTCGHSVTRPYIEAPAHCTECGARVVDDGLD